MLSSDGSKKLSCPLTHKMISRAREAPLKNIHKMSGISAKNKIENRWLQLFSFKSNNSTLFCKNIIIHAINLSPLTNFLTFFHVPHGNGEASFFTNGPLLFRPLGRLICVGDQVNDQYNFWKLCQYYLSLNVINRNYKTSFEILIQIHFKIFSRKRSSELGVFSHSENGIQFDFYR